MTNIKHLTFQTPQRVRDVGSNMAIKIANLPSIVTVFLFTTNCTYAQRHKLVNIEKRLVFSEPASYLQHVHVISGQR